MNRVIVYLSQKELDDLQAMAERDLRGLREQARYLIVKSLAAEIAAQVEAEASPALTSPAMEGSAAHASA